MCVCLTTWHPLEDDPSSPAAEMNSVGTGTTTSLSSAGWRFHYCCAIAASRACLSPSLPHLLRKVHALQMSGKLDGDSIVEAMKAMDPAPPTPKANWRLTPAFSSFYLSDQPDHLSLPLESVFRTLSHQTVLALIGALLTGKSLLLVSKRSSQLMLAGHALREMLKPFEWEDLFLPVCPPLVATRLAAAGVFNGVAPFIVGCVGELVHVKIKEAATEHRFRIRNSIYSSQRTCLDLRTDVDAADSSYPSAVLEGSAVVLDMESDDIYVPERLEVLEFPQTLVRSFELSLRDALTGGELLAADSILFTARPARTDVCGRHDGVRLAMLSFLEALLGDVVLHFCSFRKAFVGPSELPNAASLEEYLIFEVDSFLEAKIELGCRELFRQCFQTELFRRFLLRQHERFRLQS
ncbi:hypothetical protein PINS_up008615 [Pythium insidiosum]|nr:hypothetical protein PINS_up008615 [Pythium insidiosum]